MPIRLTRIVALALIVFSVNAYAFHRGIYLTQSTAQDDSRLQYLITQSNKNHIDTFVIDINSPSKTYAQAIHRVLQNGITYIARVVIFPHGAIHEQVIDKNIWAKRLQLAKYAAELGAKDIQLDYIRYQAKGTASPEKARNILKVVEYFKTNLRSFNVGLQLDIFGVAAHQPSHTIGQDPILFAPLINALCPMVYPSHYEPFQHHAIRPFQTVYNSISALKQQLKNHPHVAVYAYIELSNYRYRLSQQEKKQYIVAQIKGAKEGDANGWYAWSPNNHYDILFQTLHDNIASNIKLKNTVAYYGHMLPLL
ncbi:MAG TPA: putative glycoside hydrolase [Coxiellaceae bacterium]|nr:putative glycoside hydrolase [Coxiellaceae bacterium]